MNKVKGNVGEIATITVDLIARGVAVYHTDDIGFSTETTSGLEGNEGKWFVSVWSDSPLAAKVTEIPFASTQAEAWEFAIQYLATHASISDDLRAGVKTHRRTIPRVLRDMRDHGRYHVECELQAAEHYGDSVNLWSRLVCWVDGAATGLFVDGRWMPLAWRLWPNRRVGRPRKVALLHRGHNRPVDASNTSGVLDADRVTCGITA